MSDFNIGFVQFTTLEENKKSEKSPDVTGNLEVLESNIPELINYLQTAERELDYLEENKVVKIRLAGWNGTTRKGNPMLKGKLNAPYRPELKPAPVSNCTIDF